MSQVTGNAADAGRAGTAPLAAASTIAQSVWVAAFVIALLVPIQIYLGTIRLSFYRVVLLAALVPMMVQLFSAQPIRFRLADGLVVAYALMGAFALFMTDATLAAIGIFAIESTAPYFLARAFVRSSAQFSAMARTLVVCIVLTIPFALYENFTRDPIILTILDTVLPVLQNVPHEQRLGLDRAQVTFDHPILYGVFCAFGVSLAIYATRTRLSVFRGMVVGFAAFLSLSSGAYVAVGLQGLLFLYDFIFQKVRQRWMILAITTAILYAVIEGLSNRTMSQIVLPYLALNPGTAWTRLSVNEWAWTGIMAYPWFGLGFTIFWPAPFWVVTTSIDNFWLAIGFRHGLPSMVLLIASVGAVLWAVIFTRQTDPFVRACRTGFVITFVGLCIAVATVHLWNSTYVAFLFLLGSGMWLTDEQSSDTADDVEASDTKERRGPRYSRDLGPAYRRTLPPGSAPRTSPLDKRTRESL
ncbi:MAG: O-antigen ligase family protein [Pseudomonadota bacterium]